MKNKQKEFEYKGVLVEVYEDGFTLGYYDNKWKSFVQFNNMQSDEEIKALIDIIFKELHKLLGI